MALPSMQGLQRWRLSPGTVRRLIYSVGMVPAAWTFYLGLTDQLGADPIMTLEQVLGLWALRYIVAGLALTPLRRIGGPSLVRYRRAVGLLAFFYACLHLTVYLVLDQGLDLGAIWADLIKRPYIAIGMLAFAILVPLAITSNDALIRRMGGANWQRLHRWVYLAAAGAAVHFVLVVKSWPPEPLAYAGLVALLLTFRLALYVRKRAVTSMPRQAPRRHRDVERARSGA